jgi:hypothetical protein
MDTRSADRGTGDLGGAPHRIALRLAWVALQLVLAYWFAQGGELFFYQGF